MLIDSHCHLSELNCDTELPALLERAKNCGVEMMLSVCTGEDEYEKILKISDLYPQIFHTAGVHPSEANKYLSDGCLSKLYDWIINCAQDKKTVAVGEIGLDYFYGKQDSKIQQQIFETQLQAALHTSLPVVIHTRDAAQDTFDLLKNNAPLKGVVHCFSGDEWLLNKVLELGMYVSFSGIVTFKKATQLRELLKIVPLERLLIETDSPFLAPEPVRGRVNEPMFVKYVAQSIADIKGIEYEKLLTVCADNFFRLFEKARVEYA